MEDVWRSKHGESLQVKLDHCSKALSVWGREITGCFKDRIKHSQKSIKSLKGRRDVDSVRVYQEELKKLAEIYVQQEVFWKQRSKQISLREGDQNSRYFHASTKSRRRNNTIIQKWHGAYAPA